MNSLITNNVQETCYLIDGYICFLSCIDLELDVGTWALRFSIVKICVMHAQDKIDSPTSSSEVNIFSLWIFSKFLG